MPKSTKPLASDLPTASRAQQSPADSPKRPSHYLKNGVPSANGGKRANAGRKPSSVTKARAILFDPTGPLAAKAIEVLKNAMQKGDVDAAKYICDRVWGKARQTMDLKAEVKTDVFVIPAPSIGKLGDNPE